MRKVIAQRMVESYLTAPTFTLNYDVDILNAWLFARRFLKPIMEATGKKITDLQTLLSRCCENIDETPSNASLTEDGKDHYHSRVCQPCYGRLVWITA